MSEQPHILTAFKGFDINLACRGFQYEIGGSYTHDGEVRACRSGFHACEFPLDVFAYYPPGESRFCSVEMTGEISREGSGSKVAAASLRIVAEIGIPGIVTAAVKWILSRIDNTKHESNTGYQSAATNTGYQSAATNTGDQSAATNTGYQSAATNTGDQSAAEVSGRSSIAIASGDESRARASGGNAIVLCRRDDDGNLTHVFASLVGQNGIEPEVWYTLDENGKPRHVTEAAR